MVNNHHLKFVLMIRIKEHFPRRRAKLSIVAPIVAPIVDSGYSAFDACLSLPWSGLRYRQPLGTTVGDSQRSCKPPRSEGVGGHGTPLGELC